MTCTSAVFVGDGNLLIQCAEAYRSAGHTVRAVISHNLRIIAWAESAGITAMAVNRGEPVPVPDAGFDYLFSVANLHMLAPALIERARVLAINFHDALLPRYAGLNATSWALMAQEAMHGVTWHEMTATVDAGRIVRQMSFPVDPAETAMSLNAKCFEAGLASFTALTADIGNGSVSLTEQASGRGYFGRHRRPEDLATLDFSRPAAELSALVRALDFGQYPNPLARAKVLLGDRVMLVRSARVLDGAPSHAPGTVLAADGDSLHVATADGGLMLAGLSDALGRRIVHGLSEGSLLPAMTTPERVRLAARIPQLARGELFWSEALLQLASVDLPYPQLRAPTQPRAPRPVRVRLDALPMGAGTVAGFCAWLSALTAHQQVSLLYCDDVLVEQAQGLGPWLSPWVPLTLVTTAHTRASEAVRAAQEVISRSREAGPFPRDLPLRLGEKTGALEGVARIGVCCGSIPESMGMELVLGVDASGQSLELMADGAVFSHETIRAISDHLALYLRAFQGEAVAADVPLVPREEVVAMSAMDGTVHPQTSGCVHDAISVQAGRTPRHEAIVHNGQALTYAELDRKATALAGRLHARGVRRGDIVGLCMERNPELVVALLAIMKAGAAYLPLDPGYPRDRILYMVEDSGTALVVTDSMTASLLGLPSAKAFLLDAEADARAPAPGAALPVVAATDPAYVIYTSGSTGKPKGVVVSHRNVMNFFAGMSERVPHEPGARWLAVTSLSFDISVLELCWTLSRGLAVVLHSATTPRQDTGPEFSLFYFASDKGSSPVDRYRLMMEGAKFADQHGFSAVWTPERHFHEFGGLYPNPALTSAAIAAVTQRVKIRAGSCVLPLHHPIRVAEEWAFVDNISQGRVGVSFASGWQPNDFVLAPGSFAGRKAGMLEQLEVVRRLWRGETVSFDGPLGKPVEVQTLPRPIQKELPVWLTAAGNPETFEQAGAMGCHLLTHLLGQSVEDVAQKLKLYRAAWRKAGHAGDGHVTIMLHSFVGQNDDEVRATVRGPMKQYLASSVDLIKQAAWTFPTFVQRGAEGGKSPVEVMDAGALAPQEMDALLEHAFNRYYGTSALFGTPQRCMALVEKLKSAGVDEIACLIDFGVEPQVVLDHLHDLKQLMEMARASHSPGPLVSVAEAINQNAVTHLQCTPSMASMLVADAAGRAALSRLSALLVGGEALPLELARQLRALVPGALLNMYGPTETTVWSTACALDKIADFVPLGQPIANTRLSIRTPWGAECPALVPGELLIGGAGVTPGYLGRPELTAERFIDDLARPGSRFYRTGDLVRRHRDGALEFLGRIDHQVKIRGHRIELGEIESALARQPGVREAVVVAKETTVGDIRLAAHVTLQPGSTLDAEQLRQAVARELPEVMVPASVSVVAAFPLTPNGKVDRKALQETQATQAMGLQAAPESQLEKIIGGIWQEVLGLPTVGASDNFFDLGGHSLLVVQVQRRLREASGREVSITDMFRLPTIRALASHLSGNDAPTAVDDGLNRARARRVMRSRTGQQTTPA